MLLTPEAVEESLGDRWRLNEYRQHFSDDESAQLLSEIYLQRTFRLFEFLGSFCVNGI